MSIRGASRPVGAARERWRLLAGVAVALFGLDLLDVFLPDAAEFSGATRWALLIGPHWLVAGAVLAGVVWVERRGLGSIGLERPDARDLGLGVGGFVAGVIGFGLTRPLVRTLGFESTAGGVETVAALPAWVAVAIAVTAGVTEEVLFRGYPIERLAEATGDLRVGAAVTVAVFTAAHVPFWGLGGALQIGVWTLLVTALYVHTRNLPACVLMHVLNDLFAFVVLPALVGSGAAA